MPPGVDPETRSRNIGNGNDHGRPENTWSASRTRNKPTTKKMRRCCAANSCPRRPTPSTMGSITEAMPAAKIAAIAGSRSRPRSRAAPTNVGSSDTTQQGANRASTPPRKAATSELE